ncbi:MAG: topoisomerase DNA-binding C4 zinc finger domain-containing protein [Candidatus Tenebribacter burtonii]|jgi:hypothetical protein|nr:topoisomerase DNA-binding C4 zinc finger domain-containing protein [Candidatus Tenebribacter burtonii]
MKIELIIVGCIVIFLIYIYIADLIDRFRDKKYEKKIEPRVEQLLSKVNTLDFSKIHNDLNEIKNDFDNRLTLLKLDNDVINKCPNCGDTLTIKSTSYYGKIISCPNYPKCLYKVKISDIDLSSINKLEII